MLTADLVAARVVKGEVRPRYVSPKDPAALDLAERVVALFAEHVGRTRDALDGALAALLGEGTDYLLHRGLAKLLFDRSDLRGARPGASPRRCGGGSSKRPRRRTPRCRWPTRCTR